MKKIVFLVMLAFLICGSHFLIDKKENSTNSKNFNIYIKEGNTYVKQNTSTFPTSGYTINLTESSCTNGGVISVNASDSKKIDIAVGAADKCNLYFDPNETLDSVISSLVSGEPTNSTDVITKTAPSGASCTNTLAYDGTTDNNIRYVGADPCNYVTFNGESPTTTSRWVIANSETGAQEPDIYESESACQSAYNEFANQGMPTDQYECVQRTITTGGGWRIIGIMNNVDDGTGNLETRVKLIRNESLGSYSWDTDENFGSSNWTQADLQNELNGDYLNTTLTTNPYWYNGQNNQQTAVYNRFYGLKTNAQNLIDPAVWHLGELQHEYEHYDNPTTLEFYQAERGSSLFDEGTSSYKDCSTNTCSRPTTWTGKVALPYPSDYLYAIGGSDRTSCLAAGPHDYSSHGCWDYDWLNKPDIDYWPLTAHRYITNGYINVNQSSPSEAFAVFPTLYLKSSAGVASGDGSGANPYVIE